MPWVATPRRSRLKRLWGRWNRWRYDHANDLLPAAIGLFVVGAILLLALMAQFVTH
jgi:hypothetical protein